MNDSVDIDSENELLRLLHRPVEIGRSNGASANRNINNEAHAGPSAGLGPIPEDLRSRGPNPDNLLRMGSKLEVVPGQVLKPQGLPENLPVLTRNTPMATLRFSTFVPA
ncbi:hypothetical protein RI367_008751 [Sorochytrium milnesiophthora]